MKARSGAPTQATDRFRDSRDTATGCEVPLASSTVIFRLGLDMCLHPARAVGEVASHPHCSLLFTQKMTSRSSFDKKLMTAQNQPRLFSRSRLYLWRGIRLEIGCGIVRFLPVGLTVRAWCTHAVDGKAGQRGGPNLRRRASPRFLSLDKVLVEVMREEMLIYKREGVDSLQSDLEGHSTDADKAAGMSEDRPLFQRFLKLLKTLPWVLCYRFVPIVPAYKFPWKWKIYKVNSCLNKEMWLCPSLWSLAKPQ